jgi:hypothetical protein
LFIEQPQPFSGDFNEHQLNTQNEDCTVRGALTVLRRGWQSSGATN